MRRIAFLIRVKPEKIEEYKKLHNPMPEDFVSEIKAAGIRNYSLWLRPDAVEFGYLECDDWDAACAYLAQSKVHDRWQIMMQDYLLSSTDDESGGQPIELLQQSMLIE